jgi:hypothetical protein
MEPVNCSDLQSEGYTLSQIQRAQNLGKCSYGIKTPAGHALFGADYTALAANTPNHTSAGGVVVIVGALAVLGVLFAVRGQLPWKS